MATKPMLMGSETEYSMSTIPGEGALGRSRLHRWMLTAICAKHGWLRDIRSASGVFLDNGARYYLDTGEHNELSSPELSTPQQVAVYDRASERILLDAKTTVTQRRGAEFCITKCNLNFTRPAIAAWGQHEAYTCWVPVQQVAVQLIPHLVSRIPYAGAGYLSADPRGMGFELSQRARHISRPIGSETTRDRAIFCDRAWKPSDSSQDGWVRLNLISKDSQRCSFGMYLTYGVTALLLMLINEGHKIGRRVRLSDPVAAMRSFSLDPWLQTAAPLANGKRATAIDIQRAYLAEARSYVESGAFPDWTRDVLEHWAATLDQLEDDPLRLADRLDAYLKLALFDRQLIRVGFSWRDLHGALQTLEDLREEVPEPVLRAVLLKDSSELDAGQEALYRLVRGADRGDLGRLKVAVQFQAMEMNYHELGGLYDRLAETGQINPVVVTPEAVKQAIHNPPPGGRAEARSKTIAEYRGQKEWACDWQYVVNQQEERWVDLRNPFGNECRVTPLPPNPHPASSEGRCF